MQILCVDCMVIFLCKVYNTVDKYVCAEMSPNLCSAAQLEEHVNGGKVRWSCQELQFWGVWRELVLLRVPMLSTNQIAAS